MPIYQQQWQSSDFMPRNDVYLRDLPKNHIEKIKSVKFEFSDYKIYEKLACVPYERMMVQCFNNYGIVGSMTNLECREIVSFFKTCVRTNEVLGLMKKIEPEYFAVSEYSRDKPHFSELQI